MNILPAHRRKIKKLPLFRMDFYLQATLDRRVRLDEDSKKLLEALNGIPVLKNVKMSGAESSDDRWFEFEGSIDIPQGSKAFFAMLKQRDPEDPYDIFLRIDVNRESNTREEAEKETREWIQKTFGEQLKKAMDVARIKIGTPLEIIMDKKQPKT
jgi:hypothetical protein